MAALWPVFLQQRLNQAQFGYVFGDTAIRSDVDVGPAKIRRRTTKGVDKMSCSIYIDYTDFAQFYDFWDVTLNGGVIPFEFLHPFTQVVREFRMAEAPDINPLGGNAYSVKMVWEVLP